MYESVNRENSVKIGCKRAYEHIGIDGSKVYRITFTKTFPVAKIIHLRVDNIVALYYILKREGLTTRFWQAWSKKLGIIS